jgi:exodeoxyribonuclease VII large subunit
MNILLCHCAVQGVDAPNEIISAIQCLDSLDYVDVIIVGRGGGSYEDLIAFNDEGVARAIFECVTPIISAVGHETDYTIADFVADMRAPTPSASAEIAVPMFSDFESELDEIHNDLYEYAFDLIKDHRITVDNLFQSSSFAISENNLSLASVELAEIESNISNFAGKILLEHKHTFNIINEALSSLSPKAVLKRGYAIVKNSKDKIVSSAKEFNKAMDKTNSATVEFHDDCIKVQRIE